MNTSVENAIKERFVSFYKAMNDWYLYCISLDKDETLTYFEKTNKQKEEIKVIFDRYCTKRERKKGLPNIISYEVLSSEDDLPKMTVTSVNIDMKERIAILEVEIEDSLSSKYQYIFKNCRGEWLIDSRKRYSYWKKKVDNRGIIKLSIKKYTQVMKELFRTIQSTLINLNSG